MRKVVDIVPGAPAQRHAGAAAQAPEHPAHKTEHMPQRQQAEQVVLRLQGQLRPAVPGALAETVVRQHHGLGALRCAGGEKQDLPPPVRNAACQVRLQLLAEFLIAPEKIDVGIGDQPAQQRFWR